MKCAVFCCQTALFILTSIVFPCPAVRIIFDQHNFTVQNILCFDYLYLYNVVFNVSAIVLFRFLSPTFCNT